MTSAKKLWTATAVMMLSTVLNENATAHAAGAPDQTFGIRGAVRTPIGAPHDDTAKGIVEQPDGKLVVAGNAYFSPSDDLALVRYLDNGQVDWTFGQSGLVRTGCGGENLAVAGMLAQPDGRLVVAAHGCYGPSTSVVALRYTNDGELDPAFGTAGVAYADVPGFGQSFALERQSDGGILIGGTSHNGLNADATVVRFTGDGQLDATFGTLGVANVDLGLDEFVWSMAVDPTDRVVVGIVGNSTWHVARLTASGTLDPSFGTTGTILAPVPPNAIVHQPDDRIALAGGHLNADLGLGIARLEENGTLDPTFGTGGITLMTVGSNAGVASLLLHTDGRMIAVGNAEVALNAVSGPFPMMVLARFESDGDLDTTFGDGGVMFGAYRPFGTHARSAVLQGDGRLLVAGTAGGEWAVFRFIGMDCGDGNADAGEECDDGNVVDGDGCDSNCTATRCGNLIVSVGEHCEDGNAVDGDACGSDCRRPGLPGTTCDPAACGDGTLDVACEFCDDGNLVPGDGCDRSCLPERHLLAFLSAGEVGTTDIDANGATVDYPIEVSAVDPDGSGTLRVSIISSEGLPTGYSLLGKRITIEGLSGTNASPLVAYFRLEGSFVAPGLEQAYVPVRDGHPLDRCASTDGSASPDPCVASIVRLPDGDVDIEVRTSHFSDWDTGLGDRDGDGTPDDADTCSVVTPGQRPTKMKLSFSKLGEPLATLKWSGTFTAAGSPALSADETGVSLTIQDVGAEILDVVVPPGLVGSGCDPRDGWKGNSGRTKLVYKNFSGYLDADCTVPSSGIGSLALARNALGVLKFTAKGKGLYLPRTPSVRLQANVVLGSGIGPDAVLNGSIQGQCAEAVFGPEAPGSPQPEQCTLKPVTGPPKGMKCVIR